MSDAVATQKAGTFQQRLGLFDATMLVAGTMIGSGIFIVSADISRDVGSSGWLLAVWILTGVITIIGALSYAELAAMMPHAGGQYVYLREAYGPLWGFLYGWAGFLVIQTGTIAAVAVAFAKYLGVLVPGLDKGFGYEFAKPVTVALPLPWLKDPLVIFQRTEFTVTAGQLVAVGIIVLLTILNARGVREGKWVQNLFTVAKIGALGLLIVVGLSVASSSTAIQANLANTWSGAEHTPAFQSLADQISGPALLVILMVAGGAMVGSLFSADAWHNVTFAAAEVQNPRRNLPLSLVLGVGLVILLYVLANLAYLASLPVQAEPGVESHLRTLDDQIAALDKADDRRAAKALREEREKWLERQSTFDRGIARAKEDRVGTAVLELISPVVGATLMAVAIMISTFGCANGLTLAGPRLYYAMARDGLFFRSVGGLNNRGVPAVALVLQAIWSILLVFSGTYNELLDYVIFAALLFYALTVGSLFVLRFKRPNAERPYRAFGYPLVPAIYVALCTVLMLDLLIVRPKYTWPGLLIVLTGVPVYFVWRMMNRTHKKIDG